MSQKKIIINYQKYQRNATLSRSSEPIKKFKTKIETSKNELHRSIITKLKPRDSYLLTENQSYYRYNYSLQDEADNTNVVFFDANSRKFRTRSSNKIKNTKPLINSRNIKSNVNIGKNGKYNSNQGKTFSNARNANNNLNNNGKRGMSTNNISNKKKSIKITEKNIKNPENRAQIIKQLKKEKDELFGKNDSNRKSQLSNNLNNNDRNNNRSISNQNNNNRNIQQNMSNANNNKRPEINTKSNYMTKSFDKNQNSQIKDKQDYQLNNKLNSINKKSYQKEEINLNKSNPIKKNNSLEEQNKNQNVETSEKKEERTLILVPGQTIEKRSVVENFENPIEELIENPDGTICSIIKQTKVTTITENIPIEGNKIKTLEGAPELPMYKQQMTHIYKTVTSVSQKPGLNNKNINDKNANNANNKTDINNKNNDNIHINTKDNVNIPGRTNNNNKDNNLDNKNNLKNMNTNSDKNNAMNENINKVNIKKNLNKNEKFDNSSPKKENQSTNKKNKFQNNNINQKSLKNGKEIENLYGKDNINRDSNISPLAKEKDVKNILNNISTGKNPEENIEKLSKLLANMSEKERKAFLEKLGKETKNKNLIQKLKKSIENQVSKNSIKNQNEEYNNYAKGISSSKKFDSGMKSLYSEVVDVKEINPLKFDGLFLEINENNNERKEQNPFEGPSPYIEFYKERSIKIKEKINRLSMSQVEQSEKNGN